jgi:hypothetical protein
MQTLNVRRFIGAACLTILLAACSGHANNPYSNFKDAPLLKARLNTVTVVSDDAGLAAALQQQGYTPMTFTTNYPGSIQVEALLWGVPEPVVSAAVVLKAPNEKEPNVRVLTMPLAARGPTADSAVETAFFRNVLGTDAPKWPRAGKLDDHVRVQAWTYFIDSVVGTSKKLRVNGIPVVFDPVAITSAYLGDHKTMAIRAPDGTVVQLVEAAAQ